MSLSRQSTTRSLLFQADERLRCQPCRGGLQPIQQSIIVDAFPPEKRGAAFGLTGLLSNPVLSVFDESGTMIAQNTEWGNPVTATGAAAESATVSDFTRVNAFALDAGSADSAMVLTLPPGSYTAQLSGAEGSAAPAGIGLVEIYEMR